MPFGFWNKNLEGAKVTTLEHSWGYLENSDQLMSNRRLRAHVASPRDLLALLVEGDMHLLAAWPSVSSGVVEGSLAEGPALPSLPKASFATWPRVWMQKPRFLRALVVTIQSPQKCAHLSFAWLPCLFYFHELKERWHIVYLDPSTVTYSFITRL